MPQLVARVNTRRTIGTAFLVFILVVRVHVQIALPNLVQLELQFHVEYIFFRSAELLVLALLARTHGMYVHNARLKVLCTRLFVDSTTTVFCAIDALYVAQHWRCHGADLRSFL